MKLNIGKIPTGVRNILTESFDPLQKLTTVLIVNIDIFFPAHVGQPEWLFNFKVGGGGKSGKGTENFSGMEPKCCILREPSVKKMEGGDKCPPQK